MGIKFSLSEFVKFVEFIEFIEFGEFSEFVEFGEFDEFVEFVEFTKFIISSYSSSHLNTWFSINFDSFCDMCVLRVLFARLVVEENSYSRRIFFQIKFILVTHPGKIHPVFFFFFTFFTFFFYNIVKKIDIV